MKFRVDKDADWFGTSLVGYIQISYADLKKVLKKHVLNGDKAKAIWVIEMQPENDKPFVITIYDYQSRCKIADVTDWHIGGGVETEKILAAVKELFPNGTVQTYEEHSAMIRARYSATK